VHCSTEMICPSMPIPASTELTEFLYISQWCANHKSNHIKWNQIQIKSPFQIKSILLKWNHHQWFNYDLNQIMIWICPSLIFRVAKNYHAHFWRPLSAGARGHMPTFVPFPTRRHWFVVLKKYTISNVILILFQGVTIVLSRTLQ